MTTLTPAPREPVVARVAQPAQHHRERREPQVRLGLAAAGREEQQVHCLAVSIGRVGQARQVEQDERELERTPARRLDMEPLAQRPGHRAVRHAKGVEGIRIVRQHRDPAVDPSRPRYQRGAAVPWRSRRRVPASATAPVRDVAIHFRYCATSGLSAASTSAASASAPESLHAELDHRHVNGRRLLHFGGRDPSSAQHLTGTVHHLPFG